MHAAMILLLTLTSPDFFKRDRIEFWGPRPRKVARPSTDAAFGGKVPPPVRRLLDQPTAEHARAYLAWQRERLGRIRRALRAIEKVSREQK
jgi:hypothetical protein